jgi:hypothetical protein
MYETDKITDSTQVVQWKVMGKNPTLDHMKQNGTPENTTDVRYSNKRL